MKSIFSMKYYLFSVLLLANFLHAEISEEHNEEDENNASLGIKRTHHGLNSPQYLIDQFDALANGKGSGGIQTPDSTGFGINALANGTGGGNNSAFGASALEDLTTGNNNSAVGTGTLRNVTTGSSNSAIGTTALVSLTTGSNNSAIGTDALALLTTGSSNTALGEDALSALTTGSANNTIGVFGLGRITTGSNNVAIGDQAGSNLTLNDSNNILINNFGVVGDNNTTRIGTTGTTRAFIGGIVGVTPPGLTSPVMINGSGQLGAAAPSSIRYKENVKDMDDVSSNILDLRPVTFNYKFDENHTVIPGLIAEEVEAIMKSLVIYNKDGLVESVKYHELPVLLLNELKKAVKQINDLKSENGTLAKQMDNLKIDNATLAKHDEELLKEIDDLKVQVSKLIATVATFMTMPFK